MNGYLLLHRRMLEWEWYQDKNTKILFLHILLKANWKEGRFRGRVIPPGSFVTSYKKLSDECNLTVDEVRTALKHLEDTKEIAKQTTSKYSVITVVEWERYQVKSQANSQTNTKQIPTIEESNKGINNIISSNEDIRSSLPKEEPLRKDISEIMREWNLLSDLGIKPVTKITPGTVRHTNLRARIKQYKTEEVIKAIRRIRKSDFLTGKKTDFMITFDWFVKPTNFLKVYDGNYDTDDRPTMSEHDRIAEAWLNDEDGN